MDPLAPIARAFHDQSVQFLLIDVAGGNYYAPRGAAAFTTKDLDLFLPADPENLGRAWTTCESLGLELWSGEEPLDHPRDRWLADRFVAQRALTRVTDQRELEVDLTLTMAGFDFETVWSERRVFLVDGVEIPVARLLHIVESKHAAGRDKDRLFLATYREALQEMLRRSER